MGFLSKLFGFAKRRFRGRYKSLEVFLSGKIKPGPPWMIKDQLLTLASKDKEIGKALRAYVESKEYLNSPLITDEQSSGVIR